MFKGKRSTTVATLSASVAFWLLASCASTSPANLDLGTPADGRSYDRKVLIGANTKFVNVDGGEVIKFVVQEPDGADKSFTWRFSKAREAVVDLSALAPNGVLSRPIKVVVGPDPRY